MVSRTNATDLVVVVLPEYLMVGQTVSLSHPSSVQGIQFQTCGQSHFPEEHYYVDYWVSYSNKMLSVAAEVGKSRTKMNSVLSSSVHVW